MVTSLPAYSIDLALGEDEKALGIKVTHEIEEPVGKPLPWGPASVRFVGDSIWAADTLKGRLVEFDLNGNFKNAISLKLPAEAAVGDFCFGIYDTKKKEKAVYVCDADNPTILAFDMNGELLGQIGSGTKDVFFMPKRIEGYANEIFVLEAGKKEIYIFNQDLKQIDKFKTVTDNFTVENDNLYHFTSLGRNNALEIQDLKNYEKHIIKPGFPSDNDIDLLFCDKNTYVGFVEFREGSGENPQYQIVEVDKDGNMTRINTDYPVSFMVRSFIKDSKGKKYQIKFDEAHPDKLIIDELPESFGASEG